jgi:hypothetical protein
MRPRLAVPLAVLVGTLLLLAPAAARPEAGSPVGPLITYETSSGMRGTARLAPISKDKATAAARAARRQAVVGDVRLWPALDRAKQQAALKKFTLRALGQHIEVWVASDDDGISKNLEFPPGDCRNDDRVQLTDAQAAYLAEQFDQVMYPRESEAFSVPAARDGSKSQITEFPGGDALPSDYYVSDGARVVALVDNIRDPGFYDVNVRVGVGGFFAGGLDDILDRNVITVDGVDWLHRTGASPPDNPVPGDLCRSRSARPFLIEATFAHEYQHLLESFQDPEEVSWVNEGLSMFAESLTGYNDPAIPITATGFDGQIQCFLGQLATQTPSNPNPIAGGPENSLTVWGDQGDEQILCDYGAAESFMLFLAGRYGLGFISALHRDRDQGLASVRKLVARISKRDAQEIVHDWAAMMALDAALDGGASLTGAPKARYRTATLAAGINWANPDDYSTPGAPPNGSDYVRLRAKSKAFLAAGQLQSLTFDGQQTFPPRPVEWSVSSNALGHAGDAAFHSGSGGGFDRAIVRSVTVPSAGSAALTFDTYFDLSRGRDFGFVQVSTDGGKTWQSQANQLTTAVADQAASDAARRQLPGLTGLSGGGRQAAWITTSFDLSRYRGKSILVAFRYVSDPTLAFPGWWIDNIRLGATLLSDGSSLAGWRSQAQIAPPRVSGWTVQIIGYTTQGAKRAYIGRLKLDSAYHGELSATELAKLRAGGYDVLAAIVTYDEPTERLTTYARYMLRVNGVAQPGSQAIAR